MQDAVEKDNKANEAGRPALKKLLMLEDVTKELRRIAIQDKFLENGGCIVLATWIEALPDGTYPNLSVVQEILQCLDNLQIEPEYLINAKKLGRIIKIYANDKAKMPQVAGLAKQIMDKWSRMVFGISTTYVQRGEEYEEIEIPRRDQYRKLRQKLERDAKEALEDDNDSDSEEVGAKRKRKQKNAGIPEEQEIVRGRAGIIMPQRNAFDFVDKPNPTDFLGSGSGQAKNAGHEKIKKTMNNLKRFNRMNFTNKKM